RHDDIGDYQVYRPWVVSTDLQRLPPAACHQQSVPGLLQHLPKHVPYLLVVLGNEDRYVISRACRRRAVCVVGHGWYLGLQSLAIRSRATRRTRSSRSPGLWSQSGPASRRAIAWTVRTSGAELGRSWIARRTTWNTWFAISDRSS